MRGAGVVWAATWLLYALGILIPHALIVPYLAMLAILLAGAQMAYGPTSRAMAANAGSPTTQGRFIALFELSWGLAAAGAPLMFGTLFDWRPMAPWIVMSGIVTVGVGLIRWNESTPPSQANRTVVPNPATPPTG